MLTLEDANIVSHQSAYNSYPGVGPVRIFTVPCNMPVGVAIVQIFFIQIILGVAASEQQTSGIMALKNLPYPLIHRVTQGIDRCRLLYLL